MTSLHEGFIQLISNQGWNSSLKTWLTSVLGWHNLLRLFNFAKSLKRTGVCWLTGEWQWKTQYPETFRIPKITWSVETSCSSAKYVVTKDTKHLGPMGFCLHLSWKKHQTIKLCDITTPPRCNGYLAIVSDGNWRVLNLICALVAARPGCILPIWEVEMAHA